MNKLKNKYRINQLKKSFLRDGLGNLTDCSWNETIKQDILELEKQIIKNKNRNGDNRN